MCRGRRRPNLSWTSSKTNRTGRRWSRPASVSARFRRSRGVWRIHLWATPTTRGIGGAWRRGGSPGRGLGRRWKTHSIIKIIRSHNNSINNNSIRNSSNSNLRIRCTNNHSNNSRLSNRVRVKSSTLRREVRAH